MRDWRAVKRTELVEIELSSGDVVNAEVAMPQSGDVAWRGRRFPGAGFTADLSRISRWLAEELRSAFPERPERIGVEFGLKLAAKSGTLVGVLAEASGEASVVVRLEWTAPGTTDEPAS